MSVQGERLAYNLTFLILSLSAFVIQVMPAFVSALGHFPQCFFEEICIDENYLFLQGLVW